MNQLTQKILAEAYNSKSLLAIHVDLQKLDLKTGNQKVAHAFKNAAHIHESLRKLDVENIFIATTKEELSIDAASFAEEFMEFHEGMDLDFAIVKPGPWEKVYSKIYSSIAENKNYTSYVQKIGSRGPFVPIFDGVDADDCLKHAVMHTLDIQSQAQAIIMKQGTNIRGTVHQYLDRYPEKYNGRIHVENMKDVIGFISEIAKPHI
jgi:hypothetical protein